MLGERPILLWPHDKNQGNPVAEGRPGASQNKGDQQDSAAVNSAALNSAAQTGVLDSLEGTFEILGWGDTRQGIVTLIDSHGAIQHLILSRTPKGLPRD